MERKLEGKIAVVTGGTTGIGLATVKRFARYLHNVTWLSPQSITQEKDDE